MGGWMRRTCADSIEELFMPEKNPELKACLKEPFAANDDYFELAGKIHVRIYESVEKWTKVYCPNGYFDFIGEYMDTEIWTLLKFLVENRF